MRYMIIVKGPENLAAFGPPSAALMEEIDRLIEENAIMAAELRELRWKWEASARGPGSRRTADEPLPDDIGSASASDVMVDSSRSGTKPRSH